MLEQIVKYCRELLLFSPYAQTARDYIDNRLSISSQEKFSFGYFPTNDLLPHMIDYLGEDNLAPTNLIFDRVGNFLNNKHRYSPLENHNLILPYRDVYGNIIALVGRSILSDTERKALKISKYKNTSFSKSHHLFGLFEAKKSILEKNEAFIVEGQFDCITGHDKGLTNVVALGGSNMTVEQLALLLRYTNNISLLLDGDEAGKIGSERIMRLFGDRANIRSCELPLGYKDLDEFLSENSVEDFNNVVM